ncbi:hypothetical protein [Actinomadura formosensis]|uniref:hypothetical protein n=1 Tax=Actinomadura formosensis TaxID=60706 RepID=UPI000831138F|nr:hypothetical protein [Actinomadura formosensis]
MYIWIWRRLPGAWPTKTATALGIVIAVAAVFWYLVFPRMEAKIQFDHGVVQTPAPSGSATPG